MSRALTAGPRDSPLATTARALLQGGAAALLAPEGVVWIPADGLSELPLATYPDDLPPRRVQVARRQARRTLAGRPGTGSHLAITTTGDPGSPQSVFVFLRHRDKPFSATDRRLLGQLSPLLAAGVSAAVAAQDEASAAIAVDPSRTTLELLATLAHEMRTPLTSIKGYATALLGEAAPWDQDRVEQVLHIIDRETSTLTTLISELLEAAAIDGGHLVVEAEPVLLNRLLERLAAELRMRIMRHQIITSFPPRWPAIHADPKRMELVFRNILDNAIKYSPHGGPVTVRGTVTRQEVIVSVADRGIGIAPDDLNRLFEKFFRAKRVVRVAGSGLGLPIAYAIVEQHGGRIWAESTLGQGTTMYVALPRRRRKDVQ